MKNASYLKKSTHTVMHAGIEITLAWSPMATGFSFGEQKIWKITLFSPKWWARNLILICTWESVLSAFGWSCLWFCCDGWGKRYVNRIWSSFGMKHWRDVRDSEIRNKIQCLFITAHAHLGPAQSAHFTIGDQCVASIMKKRDWKTCWFFLVPVFTRV